MSDAPTVLFSLSDGVATLTLNRPERLNAISVDLVHELARLLADVDERDDVGCVVLTGAGRGFCSGGDFDLLGQPAGTAPLSVDDEIARLQQMHTKIPLRLYELSKPTIALVNGRAAGAGLSLATACDIEAELMTMTGRSAEGRRFLESFLASRKGPKRRKDTP